MSPYADKRVFLIGPRWGGMWTESTERALRELRCTVQVSYYNRPEVGQSAPSRRQRMIGSLRSRVSHGPNLIMQLVGVLVGRKVGRALLKEAIAFEPDIVLVLKGEWLLPGTLQRMKLKTGARLATWWADNPVLFREHYRWLMFPRCVPVYDHLFIFDHAYFDALRAEGARQITFLPCAADPSLYHPEVLDESERSRWASSVCLIGVFYPVRGEIMAKLLDRSDLAVWGPGWEPFLERVQGRDPKGILRGTWLPSAEVNRVYQAASIVLNTHHPQTKRGGLNTRAFEIPASGAFQLMDYVPEMESLLVPGSEVVCFHSPEEAAALARKYLDSPEERQRIARAGYERALREHTYRHRMETVLASLS